jgi:hypothetical protein
MGLIAGNINDSKTSSPDWSVSMAKAIEDAFIAEWPNVVTGQAAPSGEALLSMRLMFVAVARGVVKHLHDNPNAFNVQNATTDNHDHLMVVEGDFN